MPREKSKPSKRTCHRFESTPSQNNEDENIFSSNSLLDEQDEIPIVLESTKVVKKRKRKQKREEYENLIKLYRDDIDVKGAHYRVISVKSYPVNEGNSISHTILSERSSYDLSIYYNKLGLVFQISNEYTNDIIWQYHISESYIIISQLKRHITGDYLKLHAKLIDMHVVELSISINIQLIKRTTINISTQLISWFYKDTPSHFIPTWHQAISSEFNVYNFLENTSKSVFNEMNVYSIHELNAMDQILTTSGLRTKLRPYQIQGVYWMFQQLVHMTYDSHRKQFVQSTHRSNTDSQISRFGDKLSISGRQGWLPIECHDLSNDSNITTSDHINTIDKYEKSSYSLKNSTNQLIWYNIITEELSANILPSSPTSSSSSSSSTTHIPSEPLYSHSSTLSISSYYYNNYKERSLLLSDEMGMGKTIQILCLILVFKYYHTTTTTACASSSAATIANSTNTDSNDIRDKSVHNKNNHVYQSISDSNMNVDNSYLHLTSDKNIGDNSTSDKNVKGKKKIANFDSEYEFSETDEADDIHDDNSYDEEDEYIPSKRKKSTNINRNSMKREYAVSPSSSSSSYKKDVYCLCGRINMTAKDICWIQCTLCERWSHASCYALKSENEAKADESHRCLACACYVSYMTLYLSQQSNISSTITTTSHTYSSSSSSVMKIPPYHLQIPYKWGTSNTLEIPKDINYSRNHIDSKATLILMPTTLITQWVNEIEKHIPGCAYKIDYSHHSTSNHKDEKMTTTTIVSTSIDDIDRNQSKGINLYDDFNDIDIDVDVNTMTSPSSEQKTDGGDTGINMSNNYSSSSSPPNVHSTPPLRIYIYESKDMNDLKKHEYSYTDLDPYHLSQYDIIIMGIKTLQKEFHMSKMTTTFIIDNIHDYMKNSNDSIDFSSDNYDHLDLMKRMTSSGKQLRHSSHTPSKRSHSGSKMDNKMVLEPTSYYPSPILCIKFQLLIIDETQKIESESISQALYMATQITSVHRISVSGTPLGNEKLSDLSSLCAYLRLAPYDTLERTTQSAWNKMFGDMSLIKNDEYKYQCVTELFQGLVLRRTKQDMRNQLDLPPHIVTVTPLIFSEFEMALYKEKLNPIIQEVDILTAVNSNSNSSGVSADALIEITDVHEVNNNDDDDDEGKQKSSINNIDINIMSPKINATDAATITLTTNEDTDKHIQSITSITKHTSSHAISTTNAPNISDDKLYKFKSHLELLRKGCCHPQILDPTLTHSSTHHITGGTIGSSSGNSSSLKKHAYNSSHMKQQLQQQPSSFMECMMLKVDQERVKTEDFQRTLIAQMCKFAGICLLYVQYEQHLLLQHQDQHQHHSQQQIQDNEIDSFSSNSKLISSDKGEDATISSNMTVSRNDNNLVESINVSIDQQVQKYHNILWYAKQAIKAYLWLIQFIDTNRQYSPLLSISYMNQNVVLKYIGNTDNERDNEYKNISIETICSIENMSVSDPNDLWLSWLLHLSSTADVIPYINDVSTYNESSNRGGTSSSSSSRSFECKTSLKDVHSTIQLSTPLTTQISYSTKRNIVRYECQLLYEVKHIYKLLTQLNQNLLPNIVFNDESNTSQKMIDEYMTKLKSLCMTMPEGQWCHTSPVNADTSLKDDKSTCYESNIEDLLVILFPVEMTVHVSSGSTETYSEVSRILLPPPPCFITSSNMTTKNESITNSTASSTNLPTNSEDKVVQTVSGNHRSRSWQLKISKMHSTVLILKQMKRSNSNVFTTSSTTNTSTSTSTTSSSSDNIKDPTKMLAEYDDDTILWFETSNWSSYLSTLRQIGMNPKTRINIAKEIPCILGINVQIYESTLDVDIFQEFHICQNFIYAYDIYMKTLATMNTSPTTTTTTTTTSKECNSTISDINTDMDVLVTLDTKDKSAIATTTKNNNSSSASSSSSSSSDDRTVSLKSQVRVPSTSNVYKEYMINLNKIAHEMKQSRIRIFTINQPPPPPIYSPTSDTTTTTTTTTNEVKNTAAMVQISTSSSAVISINNVSDMDKTNKSYYNTVQQKALHIEKEYLQAAEARKAAANYKFKDIHEKVTETSYNVIESCDEYFTYLQSRSSTTTTNNNNNNNNTCYHREWWNYILNHMGEDNVFYYMLRQYIETCGEAYTKFKSFHGMSGLSYLIGKEFSELDQARKKVIHGIKNLSAQPSMDEIDEGSNCLRCRAYFYKTGPVCRHCRLYDVIKHYEKYLYSYRKSHKNLINTGFDSTNKTNVMKVNTWNSPTRNMRSTRKKQRTNKKRNTDNTSPDKDIDEDNNEDDGDTYQLKKTSEYQMDGCYYMICKQLKSYTYKINHKRMIQLCTLEIQYIETLLMELKVIYEVWNRHLELLKVHDELSMCTSRVQLITAENEASMKHLQKDESYADMYIYPTHLSTTYQDTLSFAMTCEHDFKASYSRLVFYKEQEYHVRQNTKHVTVMDDFTPKWVTSSSHLYNPTTSISKDNASSSSSSSSIGMKSDIARRLNDPNTLHTDNTCIICSEDLFTPTTSSSNNNNSGTVKNVTVGDDANSVKDNDVSLINRANDCMHITDDSISSVSTVHSAVMLPCAHIFHKACILKWIRMHFKCVLCKTHVNIKDLVDIDIQDSKTKNIMSNKQSQSPVPNKNRNNNEINTISNITTTSVMRPGQIKQKDYTDTSMELLEKLDSSLYTIIHDHDTSENKFSNAESDSSPDVTNNDNDINSNKSLIMAPVKLNPHTNIAQKKPFLFTADSQSTPSVMGQWGTKIDAILKDILCFLASPECQFDKAIIFSQWIEMIDIMVQALRYNNIKFSLCTNRNKDFSSTGSLQAFKMSPDIRLLIMPLYLGAEGLDLIVASHVFLLEPLLNKSMEIQAINRIHRIGQTKRTYIHKYVVLGTVEQTIYENEAILDKLHVHDTTENTGDNSDYYGDDRDSFHTNDVKSTHENTVDLDTDNQTVVIKTPPTTPIKKSKENMDTSTSTTTIIHTPNYRKSKGDQSTITFHDIRKLFHT